MHDDYAERLVAFENGLAQLSVALTKGDLENKIKSIYFPFKIGCGYGHGDWTEYEKRIQRFAADVPQPIVLCKPPSKSHQ